MGRPDASRTPSELSTLLELVRVALDANLPPQTACVPIAEWIYRHREKYFVGWARNARADDPADFFQGFMAGFVAIWSSFSRSGNGPHVFWSYLRKCYRNALAENRRIQAEAPQETELVDAAAVDARPFMESFDLDGSIDRQRLYDILREEIASLPAKSRSVIELTFLDELDDNEIAARLGVTDNCVRARRFRALPVLKRNLRRRICNLTVSDVLNWPDVITRLRAGDGVFDRIRQTFPDAALRALAEGNGELAEAAQQAIIDALNGIISTPTFFSYDDCVATLGAHRTSALWSLDEESRAAVQPRINRLVVEHILHPQVVQSPWVI